MCRGRRLRHRRGNKGIDQRVGQAGQRGSLGLKERCHEKGMVKQFNGPDLAGLITGADF